MTASSCAASVTEDPYTIFRVTRLVSPTAREARVGGSKGKAPRARSRAGGADGAAGPQAATALGRAAAARGAGAGDRVAEPGLPDGRAALESRRTASA